MTAIPARKGGKGAMPGGGVDAEEMKLEAQLHELRGLMLKERAKRAAVREAQETGGSIWSSGKPRGKNAIAAVKERTRRATPSGVGGGGGADGGAPVAGSAVAVVRSRESSRPTTPTSRPETPPAPEDCWVPPWAGVKVNIPAPPPRKPSVDFATPPVSSLSGLLAAAGEAPAQQGGGGGGGGGGRGADNGDIGTADFDEDESHASFLAALMEWRTGGKPADEAEKPASDGRVGSGRRPPARAAGGGAAAPAAPSESMECQTGPVDKGPGYAVKPRAARPGSAGGSLFAKLKMQHEGRELAYTGRTREIPVKEVPVPDGWNPEPEDSAVAGEGAEDEAGVDAGVGA